MPPKRRATAAPGDPATAQFVAGQQMVLRHPLFAPLLYRANVLRQEGKGNLCPATGWAVVTQGGVIHVHPTRRASAEEWAYVLAHCLLHLGFDHFQEHPQPDEWNAACDWVVARFLADLKFGRPPGEMPTAPPSTARSEDALYARFCESSIPPEGRGFGTAGMHPRDLLLGPVTTSWYGKPVDWPQVLGRGLIAAATSAVNVAGGAELYLGAQSEARTAGQAARAWCISHYPLLGALAATFTIIEDQAICTRLGIVVAAVDAQSREIFFNPAAGLDERESRFVMAHELLHVGLRHDQRGQGRDPYLWNVACDYVINGWLVEMGLGALPPIGVLYDPTLKAESAEAVYDRIVTDMRRYRKVMTLRGVGIGDILRRGPPDWWNTPAGADLDDFYRGALSQGLIYHREGARGLLPAGLVEEIYAQLQPPIPWDVELAQWFDEHFPPLETRRSYARASRRQSATPDIPRPSLVSADPDTGRTFGVVLDTSGSMDRALLAKALGAIAGYSLAREVPAARVVFCDAAAYDVGYLPPEAIADRVQVRGRGGTVLQPGIDLLEAAEDFPTTGPLLIITDGYCEDRLHVHRDHAFLLPEGRNLPFVPRGPVFRIH